VSKQGLTRCGGCGNHIRAAGEIRQTECPFCDAVLSQPPEADAGETLFSIARNRLIGRSGFLTASLFGLSTLGAAALVTSCGDGNGSSPSDTTQVTDVADTANQAAYGVPPADVQDTASPPRGDVEEVDDAPPVDLYGVPPDPGN
jgi:hypothetical protein